MPRKKAELDESERVRRGAEAESLMANETLQAAFFEIESDVLRQIALPPHLNSPEKREWNYLLLQAGQKLRKALAQFVQDGHLAAAVLEQANTRAKAQANGGRGSGRQS